MPVTLNSGCISCGSAWGPPIVEGTILAASARMNVPDGAIFALCQSFKRYLRMSKKPIAKVYIPILHRYKAYNVRTSYFY
jgi:hypothetical protein